MRTEAGGLPEKKQFLFPFPSVPAHKGQKYASVRFRHIARQFQQHDLGHYGDETQMLGDYPQSHGLSCSSFTRWPC